MATGNFKYLHRNIKSLQMPNSDSNRNYYKRYYNDSNDTILLIPFFIMHYYKHGN